MFFELVARNSKRSRKENGLFFTSLLIVIIAGYIILSLSHQDVMLFLTKMESDAVNKILAMVPMFYGMALLILFFLIYFAGKLQIERRRHEFGVYLMMGMQRWKLFFMLLAEDFRNSMIALLIGLPVAVLLSELISLITARLVGLGIIGHSISVSFSAILWTVIGFLLIKMAAFMILSGKVACQEIGALLEAEPENTKGQRHSLIYFMAFFTGMGLLAIAYGIAITGRSWNDIGNMGITLFCGLTGTLLLFFGLRSVIGFLAERHRKERNLQTFTFRQLQENVIYESNTLAVSSLLILAALCCFGAGVAISQSYRSSEQHVLDYTFREETCSEVEKTLSAYGLEDAFSEIFEMKTGYIYTTEDSDRNCSIDSVMELLKQKPDSQDKKVLLNNLGYVNDPYLIALTGYRKLLELAGLPQIELDHGEAMVYIDAEFTKPGMTALLNQVLEETPEIYLAGQPYHLVGNVQTSNLVVDRSITLSFALIVRDEVFYELTENHYSIYTNAVLSPERTKGKSLLRAVSETNESLDKTGISYESYLQNIGRRLFYVVAASYITIYLAVVFMVVANTANLVQFLTRQQKTGRRYKTLLKLGASYEMLCASAEKQISYYFGIPIVVAVLSSAFGVRALFSGLLASSGAGQNMAVLMWTSMAMILLLCVVEFIYILMVKKASRQYILSLVVFEREE